MTAKFALDDIRCYLGGKLAGLSGEHRIVAVCVEASGVQKLRFLARVGIAAEAAPTEHVRAWGCL
jgi:hypothetical protein